jgi:hypothetical protein
MAFDRLEVGGIEFGLRKAAIKAHGHALAGGCQQQHRRTFPDAHVPVAGCTVGGVRHLVGTLVPQPELRTLGQLACRKPDHVGIEQVEALRHVAFGRAFGRAAIAAGGRHRLDAAGGIHREHGAEGHGHHAVHGREAAGRQMRRGDPGQHVADDGRGQRAVRGGLNAPAPHESR